MYYFKLKINVYSYNLVIEKSKFIDLTLRINFLALNSAFTTQQSK